MADLGPGFGAVRLPARAAPWLSAGLKVLLRPEGWQERQAQADAMANAEAVAAQARSERTSARPDAPRPPAPARPSTPAAPPLSPSAPAPRAPATGWPQPWADYLARVARPSRVLFTYWELGADMAGVATGEQTGARRALFQEIVKQLREKAGWPKGAAGFWPIAACGQSEAGESDGGLCAQTELFLRGVTELKPRMVCVFGAAALKALDPQAVYRHGPRKIQGVNCLVLPGPEEMLPDNREAKRIVWNWLKAQEI